MDRHFEEHQLDRLITLKIRHNFSGNMGRTAFDTATRRVWARRRIVSAREQLERLPTSQEYKTVSRWEIRAGVTPPVVEGNANLIDDEGLEWRVLGVQELGRKRRLELYCVISDQFAGRRARA